MTIGFDEKVIFTDEDGTERTAFVTYRWSNEVVNLAVLMDGTNDKTNDKGVIVSDGSCWRWVTSVQHKELRADQLRDKSYRSTWRHFRGL